MRLHFASRIAASRVRRRCFHYDRLIAVVLAIAAAACGSHDGITAPAEASPVFDSLSVTNSGSTYLRVWLDASVTDVNGNANRVVIGWGDKTADAVTSDFGNIEMTHDYATSGTYDVTVVAYDAALNSSTARASITTGPAPSRCFDAYVFALCAQVEPDYNGIDFVTKLAGVEVLRSSLTPAKNSGSAYIPVGGLFGQVKFVTTGTFSRTRNASALTVKVYGCTLFLICTDDLAEKSFSW